MLTGELEDVEELKFEFKELGLEIQVKVVADEILRLTSYKWEVFFASRRSL